MTKFRSPTDLMALVFSQSVNLNRQDGYRVVGLHNQTLTIIDVVVDYRSSMLTQGKLFQVVGPFSEALDPGDVVFPFFNYIFTQIYFLQLRHHQPWEIFHTFNVILSQIEDQYIRKLDGEDISSDR